MMKAAYSYDMIQAYLQQRTVVSLSGADSALPTDGFLKIGLLPFIRRAGLSYYVMKPKASHEELASPEFQICKGTRMRCDGGVWRDMKEGEALQPDTKIEALIETALREGREELGINLSNIICLFEIGAYNFTSASTGCSKQMWMFAAEVIDASDFLPAEEVAETTAQRGWVRAEEFASIGRFDHKPILADIHAKLVRRFKD